MQRIHVVGASGAGKTTLGRRLAAALDLPFVDLDELWWQPGWIGVGHEEFARRLAPIAAGPRWVIAGDYQQTTDRLLQPRLDTLIVLDLPYALLMRRVLLRTIARGLLRTPCCNGNRESLRRIFQRDGVVRYLARSWKAKHARHATLSGLPELAHARVIRIRDPAGVRRLLAALGAPAG